MHGRCGRFDGNGLDERYNRNRSKTCSVPVLTGRRAVLKEVGRMWLRISPEMDFYLDMELQGVNEKTRESDVQQYEHVVYKEFVERLKKAFPEEDIRMYNFEFGIARERARKAA
jgi:hypothetical protein